MPEIRTATSRGRSWQLPYKKYSLIIYQYHGIMPYSIGERFLKPPENTRCFCRYVHAFSFSFSSSPSWKWRTPPQKVDINIQQINSTEYHAIIIFVMGVWIPCCVLVSTSNCPIEGGHQNLRPLSQTGMKHPFSKFFSLLSSPHILSPVGGFTHL